MKTALLVLFSFAATTLYTFAEDGLAWKTDTQEVAAKLSQDRVDVRYAFTNTSDAPIEIVETKSTCGCTVPTLEKKVYAPGESGTLNVLFEAKGKSGPYQKQIYVTTDESRDEPYELTLKIDIPRAIKFKPRVQIWRIGSEPKAKTYEITFHTDFPVDLKNMINRSHPDQPIENFNYQIETLSPQHEYRLHVTPHSTGEKTQLNLIVQVDDPAVQEILNSHLIYALVR